MLIVVLGGGIDRKGNLPEFVKARLEKAASLHAKHPRSKIVLSGRYSFLYADSPPPVTEAQAMASYLWKKGIEKSCTLIEDSSKDTIGNAYYIKKDIAVPQKEKHLVIITSNYHRLRTEYIFKKIFGHTYNLEFIYLHEKIPANEKEKVIQRQKQLLQANQELLSGMRDGQEMFLYRRIYKFKYYHQKRPGWVVDFVTRGR